MMNMKKKYIAPEMEHLNLDIPSILAGTNGNMDPSGKTGTIEYGGDAGDGDEGLSRRGGFWDDEDF